MENPVTKISISWQTCRDNIATKKNNHKTSKWMQQCVSKYFFFFHSGDMPFK